MAYGTSVTPMGSKPVKKKKPKTLGQDIASQASARASSASTSTSKNTSGNSRSGQMYRSVTTSKGVVHQYADGTRVLVKRSKKANPSRKLY